MRELIKKILYEQDTPDENKVEGPEYNDWEAYRKLSDEEKKTGPMPIGRRRMDKNVFFQVVRQLVNSHPVNWFQDIVDEEEASFCEKACDELKQVFKLYGLDNTSLGHPEADSLWAKIFYAALDNHNEVEEGKYTQFSDLILRKPKTFKIDLNEIWHERVEYTWTVTLDAYTQKDAEGEVIMNEDGEYDWWEWDQTEGFDKEIFDSDRDGIEIQKIEVEKEPSSIVENLQESNEGLESGLKKILKKWKESRTENRWYDEIEDLIKRERVNENKKSNKLVEVENVTHTTDDPLYLPAIDVFNGNEWKLIEKLVTDGINNYAKDLKRAVDSDSFTNNTYGDVAKLYGITGGRAQLIAKYITDTLEIDNSTQLYDKENPLPLLQRGKLYHWNEYEVSGVIYETTWKKSHVSAVVEGYGPNDAAYRFIDDMWEYDPKIVVDDEYGDYDAESSLEEHIINSVEDLDSGTSYTGKIEWTKSYGTSGAVIPVNRSINENIDTGNPSRSTVKITPLHLKVMDTLAENLGLNRIITDMLTQPLDDVFSLTFPILKLFGLTSSNDFKNDILGKQLIQFMADNSNDYWDEKHIGTPLPTIHSFGFTKTWIENERVEKEGYVELLDTNFESANCAVNRDFWDYSPDIESTDVIDSDYEGDDQYSQVWVDNKEVWQAYNKDKSNNRFDPNNSDCG